MGGGEERNEFKKIFKAIMKMPFMQYKTHSTIMNGNQQEAKLRTNIKYVEKKVRCTGQNKSNLLPTYLEVIHDQQ